ncbi:hypothetical protein P4308_19675 [Bacillus wiedmannii]|nr:hypothetical protein [Bacillus wiedmannii]
MKKLASVLGLGTLTATNLPDLDILTASAAVQKVHAIAEGKVVLMQR